MATSEELKLGGIAVEKGLITRAQLDEAIEVQQKITEMGITKNLAEVLLDKKFLSKEQLQVIWRAGGKTTKEIGDFELLAKLGEGGMGGVYKARQKHMDRIVALKLLPPRLAKNQNFIERFHREARAGAKLNHVNIVSAIDTGEVEGYHYFVMEYIEGKNLYRIIREKKVIPEAEALHYTIQIARALQHAAEHHFVHRDVKPQNILVTPEGVAKLTDLGLARSTSGEDVTLTQTGMALGTPDYISPEQARGEKDIDIRSDIYSLGATLYHMVTGEPPFSGSTAAVIMTKHLTEEIPSPLEKNPDLTEHLCRVIEKMMAKKRPDRYQSPAELMTDLELVIDGKSPSSAVLEAGKSSVRMVSPQLQKRLAHLRGKRFAPPPARKVPLPLIAGVAAGVVVLIIVIVIISHSGTPEKDTSTKPLSNTPPETLSPNAAEPEAEKSFNTARDLMTRQDWLGAIGKFDVLLLPPFKDTNFTRAHTDEINLNLKLCVNAISNNITRLLEMEKMAVQNVNWPEAQRYAGEIDKVFEQCWKYVQNDPDARTLREKARERVNAYTREMEADGKIKDARQFLGAGKWPEAAKLYRELLTTYDTTVTVANDRPRLQEEQELAGWGIKINQLLQQVDDLTAHNDWENALNVLRGMEQLFRLHPDWVDATSAQTVKDKIKECEDKLAALKPAKPFDEAAFRTLRNEYDAIANALPVKDTKPVRALIPRLKQFARANASVTPPDKKAQLDAMMGFCLAQFGPEKILFISYPANGSDNTNIYVINPDGTGLYPLTNHLAKDNDTFPLISPDGTRIMFTSNRGGTSQLYEMKADGSEPRPLTGVTDGNACGSYAPDGKKIYFLSVRDGPGRLYVMEPDGSNQKPLVPAKLDIDHCRLSPDGRKIVILDSAGQLYTVPADGSAAPQPLKPKNGLDGYGSCVWSPDGQAIVGFGWPDKKDYGHYLIYRIDLKTNTLTKLTDPKDCYECPLYSADGQWLYIANGTTLWRMDNRNPKKIEPVREFQEYRPIPYSTGKLPYRVGIVAGPLGEREGNSDWIGCNKINQPLDYLANTPVLEEVIYDPAIKDNPTFQANLRTLGFDNARDITKLSPLVDCLIMNCTYIVTPEMSRAIKDYLKEGGNLIMVECTGCYQVPDAEWVSEIMGAKGIPQYFGYYTPDDEKKLGAKTTLKTVPGKENHPLIKLLAGTKSLWKEQPRTATYWPELKEEAILAEIELADGRRVPAIMERRYGQGRIIHLNWKMDTDNEIYPLVIDYLRSGKAPGTEKPAEPKPPQPPKPKPPAPKTPEERQQAAQEHIDSGNKFLKSGEYPEAIAEFKEALRLNPEIYWAYCNLGLAYLANGDYDRAVDQLNILKRKPGCPDWIVKQLGDQIEAAKRK